MVALVIIALSMLVSFGDTQMCDVDTCDIFKEYLNSRHYERGDTPFWSHLTMMKEIWDGMKPEDRTGFLKYMGDKISNSSGKLSTTIGADATHAQMCDVDICDIFKEYLNSRHYERSDTPFWSGEPMKLIWKEMEPEDHTDFLKLMVDKISNSNSTLSTTIGANATGHVGKKTGASTTEEPIIPDTEHVSDNSTVRSAKAMDKGTDVFSVVLYSILALCAIIVLLLVAYAVHSWLRHDKGFGTGSTGEISGLPTVTMDSLHTVSVVDV